MAERVTQQVVEAAGTGQVAAERVTQQVVEAAGTGQVSAERVTQQVVEAAGTGQIPYVRVTQLYTEVAALYLVDIISMGSPIPSTAQVFTAGGVIGNGIPVVGGATVPSTKQVFTGGVIALIQPDIPIVGVSVVASASQVFTTGTLTQGIPVTGTAVVPSASQVFTTGGTLTQGIPITGSTAIPSTAAVNAGGQAALGLYTITPGITSQIALMDLGAIGLGQVLGSQGIIDITGPFVGGVIPSTAQVFVGGVIGNGIPITGTATVPTSASVFTAGVVRAGYNLVGSVTIPSTAVAYDTGGGAVILQSGILILGNVPVPSTKQVFVGGVLAGLGIFGTTTIPSTAQVFVNGLISGIPAGLFNITTNEWSGYGLKSMTVLEPNDYSRLLDDEKRKAELLISELTTNTPGLSGLSSPISQEIQSSQVPPLYTGMRKNFFERGKLLTPADGGLANWSVVQFTVPTGHFGLILGYYCNYMGTGFVQGSGDIVWRLRVGNAWMRNMGNLQFAMGSLSNPFSMPLMQLLTSDDTITFAVNVPNTSGLIQVGTSYILCGLQGWYYPNSTFKQRPVAPRGTHNV